MEKVLKFFTKILFPFYMFYWKRYVKEVTTLGPVETIYDKKNVLRYYKIEQITKKGHVVINSEFFFYEKSQYSDYIGLAWCNQDGEIVPSKLALDLSKKVGTFNKEQEEERSRARRVNEFYDVLLGTEKEPVIKKEPVSFRVEDPKPPEKLSDKAMKRLDDLVQASTIKKQPLKDHIRPGHYGVQSKVCLDAASDNLNKMKIRYQNLSALEASSPAAKELLSNILVRDPDYIVTKEEILAGFEVPVETNTNLTKQGINNG